MSKEEEQTFFKSLEDDSLANPVELTLQPQDYKYTTIWMPHVTAQQAAMLKDDHMFVYFAMMLRYQDGAGMHYSECCQYFAGEPVFRLCLTHNLQR